VVPGALAGSAGAAPSDYEGRILKRVAFSPANQPYSAERLGAMLPLKTGEPLRGASVRAAIERLYATGRYEDIAADAENRDGGVVLTFITKPNYFIGRVTVEGVPDPPTSDALINAARLDLGTLYTRENLDQALRNIAGTLHEDGFFEPSITPRFEHDAATQQVHIHFDIDPGKRARYSRPIIEGAAGKDADSLVHATRWKGWFNWQKVTDARTGEGIDRILQWYRERDRLEASVALGKLDYDRDTNRVTPAIKVDPGPKVEVRLTGAGISRGKMRQLLPVYEEQSVDRDLLNEGAQNLREYLESKGYFNASVKYDTLAKEGTSERIIEYKVDRGERHKVVAVTISGNRYFDTATLRERMYVRPATLLQYRHGRYSEALIEKDIDAIESLYRSSGFRDVSVKSRIERGIDGKDTDIGVHIDIREGPQWLVSKLIVTGVSDENREAVLGMLQSQEGQPFSEFNASIDRDNVLTYYFDRGYPDAAFDYKYGPAEAPHGVELRYAVHEGERKFVRGVLITGGLKSTDQALVRQRIMLQPGDPLSRSAMLETQRRLYELGIFARVDMAMQNPEGDEQDKNVLLNFEEARRWTVTGGIGAEIAKIGGCSDCYNAPAGEAGFSPRVSFGVTRRNFLGAGHMISLQSRFSTLEQRGVLSYNAPQFRGNENLSLLFSALYDDSREVRTFTARRREVSAQFGQRLSRASTLLYRLTYRRVSVSDLKISDAPLLPQYLQPVQMGIIGGNYILDRRDDPTDTHRGIYTTVDLSYGIMPGADDAPGITGFLRFLGHNATYYPLGGKFVLARSLTFGWMQQPSATREIPLPERFYAGGPTSLRGFPSNQAGPRDPETGFPIGGRAVLANQVELRFPVMGDTIGGSLFLDSGNVYSDLSHLSFGVHQQKVNGNWDFNYMEHAIGVGIRYRTPVGPVRLDVGYALNPPHFYGCDTTQQDLWTCDRQKEQQIGHFQFHFSIGQAF